MIIATLIAGGLGQTILTRFINDVANLVERIVSVALARAMIRQNLGPFVEPENMLKAIAPEWSRAEWEKALAENPKIKGVENFINFLKDFNLRFADVNVAASILGPSAAYATTQIGSAYQWSYGLGWLSWIGTGQVLQKLVAEPIRQELDKLFPHKLLTEAAAKELWLLGIISDEQLDEALTYQGYSKEKREFLKKALIHDLVSGKVATLVRLRIIDKNMVIGKLKSLGVKEDVASLAVDAAFKEPSLSVIIKSLKAGRITQDEAIRWLRLQGYSDEAIALILDSAKEERIEKDKELAKSDILGLFRYRIINESEALDALKALGYDDREARLLIDLTKARIPKEKVEKGRDLSKADVLKALRLGVITQDEATDFLKRLGYDDTEIKILLAVNSSIANKEPEERKREIAKSDILRALRLGIITKGRAYDLLKNLGYSDEQIELLLKIGEAVQPEHRSLTPAQVGRAFQLGIMTEGEARQYWKALGYNEYEIDILVKLYAPKAS